MQIDMFNKAKTERDESMAKAYNWEQFMSELNQKKIVLTPWCEEEESEKLVKEWSKEELKVLKKFSWEWIIQRLNCKKLNS